MVILRQALYRAGEKLYRWPLTENLRRLEAMEHWPAERLREWQWSVLDRLVRHAYANVPFYRDLWRRHDVHPDDLRGIDDLGRLPTVRKEQLRAAGRAALDRRRSVERLMRDQSSGSTGNPFTHYKDRVHHAWMVAGALHGWQWAGWRRGEPWIRLQHRGRLTPAERFEDWMAHCLHMPIDRFSEAFFDEFLPRAVRFGPRLLRGYSGGTYVFARYLLERGSTDLRPAAVVCTGDTLYAHYREAIERAFACPVFDTYGGEGMHVANQCAEGLYHVLPTVLVELVGAGPELPEGRSRRIVLTSLTNNAMPFLRYDIGDIGIGSEASCRCGRSWPALRRVVGRETDIVTTPAGRHLICHHFDTLLRDQPGVLQYQVVQDRPERITLRLVVDGSFRREIQAAAITRRIRELGGGTLGVDVELVPEIPLPASGKRRYVISNVGLDLRPSARAGSGDRA
jgi:phenylacetate-CoA ligase